MSDEVQVNVVADTSGLQEGMQQAKASTTEAAGGMSDALNEAGKKLAEFFAVGKVAEFVKESITDFAQYERSLDILGAQVKAAGGNWDAMKDSVDSLLEHEQILTGVNKNELAKSLSDLYTKTGDMTASMKLLDTASKLAAVTGQDQRTVVDALGLAYEGNTRGVTSLGRILGLTSAQAKDANLVWDDVTKKVAGFNDVAGDTQGKLNSIGAAWDETKENVGGTLSDLIPLFQLLERVVATLIQVIITLGKGLLDIVQSVMNELIALGTLFDNLVHGQFKEGFKTFISDSKNAVDNWTQDAEEGGNKIAKIWGFQTKDFQLETDKQLQAGALANQKRITDAAAAEKKIQDAHDAAIKAKEATDQAAADAQQKRLDDELEEWKKVFDELGKGAQKMGEDLTKSYKKGGDAEKAFAKDGMDTIKNMLSGLLKAWALYWYELAAAAAVSGNVISAGLDAAAGTLLEVAAGAIQSLTVPGLAAGGIVNSPTLAMVGEAGPEAVVPLSQGAQYGFGGGGDTHHHYHLPGVKDGPGFAGWMQRSGSRQLIAMQADVKRRSGNRNTSY